MKVIIAGSRDINDLKHINQTVFESKFKISEVVSGTARGVDRLGERWAKENNVQIKQFPANWDKLGKSAGVIRNKQMAEYADALIAIWDGHSVGTKHMINIALKMGLQVYVHIIKREKNGTFQRDI